MLNHLFHPFVLYASAPHKAPTRMRVLDADAISGITPLLRERLLNASATVQGLGFSPPTYCAGHVPRIDSAVALFDRADRRAIAFIQAAEGKHTPMAVSFTIRSEFEDGRVIFTSNSRVVMRTPPRKFVHGVSLPGCPDLALLWAVHEHQVRTHERQSALRHTTRGDDPVGYEFDDAVRVMDHWVRSGYYVRLADGRLKFTPKGATLAAWRGLYPWKQLTERRKAREAAAVLRAAGLPA